MIKKVILVSLDTLRSDGLLSDPQPLWPARYKVAPRLLETSLDDWISHGSYFPNCISAAPYTSASHASFFTGLWPRHHGVYEFFNRSLVCDTIFSAAKRLGYSTIWKVDFPIILGHHLGLTRDVDSYLVEDDDVFLDQVESADQVFAFAHFGGIHIPYGFHNLRFGGEHYRRRVEELEGEIDLIPDLPGDQLVETYRDTEDLALLYRYKRVVQHHYERAGYDKLFAMYLDGIEHFMLNRFEGFLKRLKKIADESDSLVIFFADHGEEYDADSYGHHNSLNEGVLRVPVIFCGRDVPAAIHRQRIRSIDLAPTLLDMLGSSNALGTLDGQTIAGTIFRDEPLVSRLCLSQAYTCDTAEFVAHQAQMLRSGTHRPTLRHVLYKEAVYLGNEKLVRQHFRYASAGGIFDLESCPRSDRFYIQDQPNSTWREEKHVPAPKRLGDILDSYNQEAEVGSPIDVSEPIREMLGNMGYRI